MNTSNGFNSTQMFTAFLPEDFQIISKGRLKTVLGRFRSPTRAPVAALGPRADPPNAAERPCEGRGCRAGRCGRVGSRRPGRGPRAPRPRGCAGPAPAWVRRRGGAGAGAPPVPMNHGYCGRR